MPQSQPHGVLLIDKPAGITSFDVIRQMRRLLRTKKIGHAGTLDPFATGLLVICVGHYTRFAGYLTDDAKAYRATVQLGVKTNTHDTEGDITDRRDIPPNWSQTLSDILPRFQGNISQVPPAFSAIHVDGKRAYDLARKGEKVEIPARDVTIEHLEVVSHNEDSFVMEVRASKGTYIRALGRDIGDALECGAHLRELRRLQSGAFHIDQAHSLDDFHKYSDQERIEALLKDQQALPNFDALTLHAADVKRLQDGKKVGAPVVKEGCYAAYAEESGALLGLVDVLPNSKEGAVLGVETQPHAILKVRRLLPTS